MRNPTRIYSKLILMLALAAVTTAGCIVFVFFTIFWRLELSSRKKILNTEIPVIQNDRLAAESGADASDNPDIGALMASMGHKEHIRPKREMHRWNSNELLIREAVKRFSDAGKWGPAIALSLQLPLSAFPENRRFELVTNFYRQKISDVFHEEAERLKSELHLDHFHFDNLPYPIVLTYMENVRLRLLSETIPEEVVRIMIKAFMSSSNDPFLRDFIAAQLARMESPVFLKYADAKSLFIERFTLDSTNPDAYIRSRFDILLNNLDQNTEGFGKDWLLAAPANNAQKQSIRFLIRSMRNKMTMEEYESLPPLARWIIAQKAVDENGGMNPELLNETFSKTFSGTGWIPLLQENIDMDGTVLAQFRKIPGIADAMYHLDYKTAAARYKSAWEQLFGTEIPEEIYTTFLKPILLEQIMWKEVVDEKLWQTNQALLPSTANGVIQMNLFYNAVKNSFPVIMDLPEEIALKRNLLTVLMRLNRGEDPRYIHNSVKMIRSDLRKHLDLKELNYDNPPNRQ